ncbi:MAG TPA: SCO family protein [Flavipsychrobacter sp.]|nr:SCO family protein [Flavipsychrobacter sp.]
MFRTASSKSSFILLLCLCIISCTTKQQQLPYYNAPDFTPVFVESSEKVAHRIPHQIGDFSFTDQDGKAISEKDIEGRIHIANFIFTSCGSICPAMTQNLKKASEYFQKDNNIVFLSFSVTPWIDSVPILKAYKQQHHITNPNWHFLTGSKEKIYRLARTSYFAEEDLGFTKDSTEFLHTEHILLIDKTKRIRGIYNGTLQLDVEHLMADIETLSKE